MQNFILHYLKQSVLFSLLFVSCTYAQALNLKTTESVVSIQNAWVRPSNPGQEVGAAYMTFLSKQDVTLVRVESSVTDSVEIHNMTMENGVMKMRMLESLPLKAGKPYKLAPGGFHLMLFDLKRPLVSGEEVNFVLYFKAQENKSTVTKKALEFKQSIKVPVLSKSLQKHSHTSLQK